MLGRQADGSGWELSLVAAAGPGGEGGLMETLRFTGGAAAPAEAPAAAWFRRFESDEPGSPRAAAAHGSATATLQAHLIASGWVDFLERAHLFKV